MAITLKTLGLWLAALALVGCAHTPADDPSDPLEGVNRAVFTFNVKADRYLLRPVAKQYARVVPSEGRRGLSNFFDNLQMPVTIFNDLLQLKFQQSVRDTGRFTMNSTIGLLGFMDVASDVGLTPNREDLGQTLGFYGLGQGIYLMLPLMGPTTGRDFMGFVGNAAGDPSNYLPSEFTTSTNLLSIVNTRSGLLDADGFLDSQPDPYVFLRTTYLQNRESAVYDGNPPAPRFEE